MDRLTCVEQYKDGHRKWTQGAIFSDMIDRLAAYEDTGLTPDEVDQIRRAAQTMMFPTVGDFVRYAIQNFEDLEKYRKTEAEGRLIVLPCKVGDKVYRICPKCNNAHDGSCDNCAWQGTGGTSGCNVFGLWGDGSYDAHHCTIVPWVANYYRMPTIIKKLGTRIFLTREEAEAALGETDNE